MVARVADGNLQRLKREDAMSNDLHPYEPLDSASSGSAAVLPHASFTQAIEEYDRAWRHPQHTPIELEPLDVNAMLQQDYILSEPVRLTRSELWDAEAKKAWDPHRYIPDVVREGQSWGRTTLTKGDERFLRASQQRAWKGDPYGQILEEVYLSPREGKILFLGRAELVSEDGRALRAGRHQPLFHVEHSVGGTNTQPLNLWRIVHLTPEKDDALAQRQVTAMADVLRQFIAIYVERELGRKLTRR
jgi:hypothetical protein